MPSHISFKAFTPSNKNACLRIFDANCPTYFAENERADYAAFLENNPEGYDVCVYNNDIVGAYGLCGSDQEFRELNWILISPSAQGIGIGHEFLSRAIESARSLNLTQIKIAASHLSAPFFAKYGALEICEIPDGWGLGMHRIDMELNLS
ncbi:GNAT family N-acetyltransferase [Vibrio tapetis]|uniref:Acetyltransferase family protein n=1 Tax=Vibrio tapetis subsp. tapetis TaxID=1671868 RepID=A0A2N8ZJK0_9VIBR|nr:GNAT family N-acetyltransferase [Vibrio tapetis]SON52067.1 Acetyltransferase family protein [Vibrio tapetis subsp. tapetis]